MSSTTNAQRLARLNKFRELEGKAPFADWRNARHTPMLDAYEKAQAEYNAEFEAAIEKQANEQASTGGAEAETIGQVANKADFAGHTELQDKARELAKTKSYKEVANYSKSLVDKPVGFVHQFLSDNPGLTRKEAVIALTEGYGVNYSTARTQYQRWFAGRKG